MLLGVAYFYSNPTSLLRSSNIVFSIFFFCCLRLCRSVICDLAWFTTARRCQMFSQGASLLYPSCLAGSPASQHALTCSFIHPSIASSTVRLPSSPHPPPVFLAQFKRLSRQPSVFLCNPPPVSPLSLGLSYCLTVFLLSCSLCFCLSDGDGWCTFLLPFLALSNLCASKKDRVSPRDLLGAVKKLCPNFVLIQRRVTESLLERKCNIY